MTTPPTDLELQQFLAGRLPEKIHYSETDDAFYWHDAQNLRWQEIRSTEWLHIVQLVEQTLTQEQIRQYVNFMLVEWLNSSDTNFLAFITTATWQTKARALAQVLNKWKDE